MAKFAPHMGDPHGDPQTSPQHSDPHGFLAWFSFRRDQLHVDRRVVTHLEGREPPLTLRQEIKYLYFGHFFPVRRGLFSVVRDFLCIIPTEQVLYYRNLGLYYGLASGTLPLYSGPCLGVRGGCVACDCGLVCGSPCGSPMWGANFAMAC